jgi:hypothetical protein
MIIRSPGEMELLHSMHSTLLRPAARQCLASTYDHFPLFGYHGLDGLIIAPPVGRDGVSCM